MQVVSLRMLACIENYCVQKLVQQISIQSINYSTIQNYTYKQHLCLCNSPSREGSSISARRSLASRFRKMAIFLFSLQMATGSPLGAWRDRTRRSILAANNNNRSKRSLSMSKRPYKIIIDIQGNYISQAYLIQLITLFIEISLYKSQKIGNFKNSVTTCLKQTQDEEAPKLSKRLDPEDISKSIDEDANNLIYVLDSLNQRKYPEFSSHLENSTSFSLDWSKTEPKLEAQFLKTHYHELQSFGPVILAQFAALSFADLGFELYEYLTIFKSGLEFGWTIIFFIGSNILLFTLFRLSKRTLFFQKYFSSLATLVIIMGIIEKSLLQTRDNGDPEILLVLLAICSTVSIVNYSQWALAISYIACEIYLSARCFFYYDRQLLRWLRFSTYHMIAFVLIFLMQRAFTIRRREIFIERHSKKQLLQFFHQLINVFHDGLILTYGEEIIYHNQKVPQILDLEDKTKPSAMPGKDNYIIIRKVQEKYYVYSSFFNKITLILGNNLKLIAIQSLSQGDGLKFHYQDAQQQFTAWSAWRRPGKCARV